MPEWLIGVLLLGGVMAYLIVGLAPFDFDFGHPSRFHIVFITPVNAILNWACFIPFGILIAKFPVVEKPIVVAGIFCAVLSLSVECLQLFIPGRFAVVTDWLLNTTGGITGAVVGPLLFASNVASGHPPS